MKRPGEPEKPIDKAAERLRQFEQARRPQSPEKEEEVQDKPGEGCDDATLPSGGRPNEEPAG
jgi:hypothetical protein